MVQNTVLAELETQRTPLTHLALSAFFILQRRVGLVADINMASTSTLPPLDPLLRTSVKRTRDIFAASSTDGLKDDEKW